MLSSPCLTSNVNVPWELFTFAIWILKLSADPDTKDPSEFCAPASNAPEALLYWTPFPKVSKVNGAISVPPCKLNKLKFATPGTVDPVKKASPLNWVPTNEPDRPNVVLFAFAFTGT